MTLFESAAALSREAPVRVCDVCRTRLSAREVGVCGDCAEQETNTTTRCRQCGGTHPQHQTRIGLCDDCTNDYQEQP